MIKPAEIQEFVEGCFEIFGLDYTDYFGYFTLAEELVDIPMVCNGEINMDMVALAGQALGLSTEDILSANRAAVNIWREKYPIFSHLHKLEHQFKRSYYSKKNEDLWLLEALFDVNLDHKKTTRYNYPDVAKRLVKQLKEMDKSMPGTYHPDGEMLNLKIATNTFCSYTGIEGLVNCYVQMFQRLKELFFLTFEGELSDADRNEYNLLVSTFGVRDKACTARGYLYYDNLRRCAALYKQEGLFDFFDIVNLDRRKNFEPWRCKEFVQNRDLVQAYVNIIPESKKAMREYAMQALQFRCIFSWSDGELVELDPLEEEYLEEVALRTGKQLTEEDRPRIRTVIYVPKNDNELDGDREIAEELTRLSGAEKLGGVSLPKHTIGYVFDVNKMTARMKAIKPHMYTQWYKIQYGCEFEMLPADTANGGGAADE